MGEWREAEFGKIPDEWDFLPIIKLKSDEKPSIAMGPFGSNIKAENFVDSGVPVIRGTNFNFHKYINGEFVYLTEEKANELKGSICRSGDLVFTHRWTIGQVGLIPKGPYTHYVVSQSGMKLTVNQLIVDPEFLLYFFISKFGQYQILKYESQVGVPSISNPLTSLKQIEVPLPPLLEQKAIASVLSSLDDKIDLLHRQNKTLEAMAETLFRQWFVEEAQEDWEDGKIPDEFDYIMGVSPLGESYNEAGVGIPMFQGNADFEFRFPKRRIFTTAPKRFAEKYDTLISVRAPVGAQNMANEKCCIGRGVSAFRYKRNNAYYTYTYFKMKSLMKKIEQYNDTGTVFGSISQGDFDSLEVVLPPYDLVDKFQEEAKPIDDKIIANTKQIRTLEKLCGILLPKLMSGEVRVKV